MRKASITTALFALIACVAMAAPLKRIIDSSAAAGAQTDHTFAEWDGIEGALASVLIRTATANATGTVSVVLTRGGSYTNVPVYSKALTNQQTHVVWFENDLYIRSTDTLSVTNDTTDTITYSITVTK